jgi:hypothetical protein
MRRKVRSALVFLAVVIVVAGAGAALLLSHGAHRALERQPVADCAGATRPNWRRCA